MDRLKQYAYRFNPHQTKQKFANVDHRALRSPIKPIQLPFWDTSQTPLHKPPFSRLSSPIVRVSPVLPPVPNRSAIRTPKSLGSSLLSTNTPVNPSPSLNRLELKPVSPLKLP
ncbi:hypothetical protein GEMRC1_002548 [Eukaryota sp. GEM-RC1]